jgi:3-dehydroquinate synthase
VIGNPELFGVLEEVDVKVLRRDAAKLEWVIAESVKLKANVVSRDEREGGLRRVLNFGHTIGHALEAATHYRRYLHGEAVAWGMIAAADIAAREGRSERQISDRIKEAVWRLGSLPKVDADGRAILRLLQADKKTRNGVVHFVLPCQIGKVEIDKDVSEQAVIEAVSELSRMLISRVGAKTKRTKSKTGKRSDHHG